MSAILVLGIAVQDFVFAIDAMPARADKYRARDLAVVGGGTGANAAVAIARLGGTAHFLTRLGDDDVGRRILDDLSREGVDVSGARLFEGRRSPLSAVMVDRAGERLVVNYADAELPAGVDWLPTQLSPDIGAVLADIRWEAGSRHVLERARAARIPGVLDFDRRVSDPALISAASHVAMSLQAMAETTGTDDPAEGLARLASSAGNWLAVTAGERGVWFTEDGRISHLPAFQVEAVDTLGAGDVFHGALALALAERMPARAAVRFASAAAALKCTRFGGRAGAPTRPEVERLMASAEETMS